MLTERILVALQDPVAYSYWLCATAGTVLAATLLSNIVKSSIKYHAQLSRSPPVWKPDHWPLAGAVRFFTARADMWLDAVGSRWRNNFSFFIGNKLVVGIGGSAEGRTAFFEDGGLDLMHGTTTLILVMPPSDGDADRLATLTKSVVPLQKYDVMSSRLPYLTKEANVVAERLLTNATTVAPGEAAEDSWSVMNPFDTFYRLVYQMTMWTVGAEEVAENPKLADYTLNVFNALEQRSPAAKLYFPWFPDPNHFLRLWDGFRLYRVFSAIVKNRQRTGERRDDAVQSMVDRGRSIEDITIFVINGLYGGQVNTGINASWIPIFLSVTPVWKQKVVDEVDGVIARHRQDPNQSVADILGSLSLQTWQSEFPIIDLCLRESIRLTLMGSAARKNTTSHDVVLSTGKTDSLGRKTTEVVPPGAYVAFLVDMVHRNPEIYSDPERFDPERFEPHRAEDKKVPHGFIGWGSGKHPCLGTRLAKIEVTVAVTYFISHFDFELAADSSGRAASTLCPPLQDRNGHSAAKPKSPVYLRYKPRHVDRDRSCQ